MKKTNEEIMKEVLSRHVGDLNENTLREILYECIDKGRKQGKIEVVNDMLKYAKLETYKMRENI